MHSSRIFGSVRMVGLFERAKTRIPSITGFMQRAFADPRCIAYDLLPIVATPQVRGQIKNAIARLRPKTPGFSPSGEARAIHAGLLGEGVVTGFAPVPAQEIAEIRGYFDGIPCIDPFRPHLGEFSYDAPPSAETNMGFYRADQIVAAPHVLRLFNDPLILQAMELYLGCKPMIDNIGCWWSFAGRTAAKGTQRYHRDLDCFGGAKLFIYLTDVDEDSGPHVFVKGSHQSKKLATGQAQSDDAVRQAFGCSSEVSIGGRAGTRFMADTFGYHKGVLPGKTSRLLLCAQYTVNRTPHLPQSPLLTTLPDGFDRFVNKLLIDSAASPVKSH